MYGRERLAGSGSGGSPAPPRDRQHRPVSCLLTGSAMRPLGGGRHARPTPTRVPRAACPQTRTQRAAREYLRDSGSYVCVGGYTHPRTGELVVVLSSPGRVVLSVGAPEHGDLREELGSGDVFRHVDNLDGDSSVLPPALQHRAGLITSAHFYATSKVQIPPGHNYAQHMTHDEHHHHRVSW